MAAKENKKRGDVSPPPPRWSNEVHGLLWITGGLFLLCSIVRYSPADLPRWQIFEVFADKSGATGQNLIGPLGGILAFLQIILFGAAGYLIPVAFLWFGILKILALGQLWPRLAAGFAVLLVTASVWLDAADYFFLDWARTCHIHLQGPGGLIGSFLGELLASFIGQVGTLILTTSLYIICAIILTGCPPIQFATSGIVWLKRRISERRKTRIEQELREARQTEIRSERERMAELRRQEREAAREATRRAEAEKDPQAMLPLPDFPAPQIIDASQRRASTPTSPGEKPFERTIPTHAELTSDGFGHYELPGFDLLDEPEQELQETNRDELLAIQQTIVTTLADFGIEVSPGDITRGPTITRYEIYPSTGLRVSRITQLEADIARATCAERINILAPIPGKDTVGIEIANTKKIAVPLHELLHDPEFRSAKKKIPLALGKDVYGKTVIGDLAAMPHLLVAGATGSGKSVCINSIIASMLFKFGPDELRFIMVDPKVVEMQMYNRLPHLVVPVVTDPKKTVAALRWVVNEMEKRYRIFAREGVRNFDSFNNRPRPESTETTPVAAEEPEDAETLSEEQLDDIALDINRALEDGDIRPEEDEDDEAPFFIEEKIPDRFPYIVVLIDELADLMQTAPADVEMCIARIAQKARAAGIHLIIATQTPRADVVTGIIKANIPCRIAFQVSSQLDSRVILDTKGAEKLVGKGDMLYLPPGSAKLERAQGAFVTDAEVERIIEHCAAQSEPRFVPEVHSSINASDTEEEEISEADEEMIQRCIEVVRQEQKCSTSLLQRRLRLGYTRAARMVDILEQRGICGPGEGAKPREVFLK